MHSPCFQHEKTNGVNLRIWKISFNHENLTFQIFNCVFAHENLPKFHGNLKIIMKIKFEHCIHNIINARNTMRIISESENFDFIVKIWIFTKIFKIFQLLCHGSWPCRTDNFCKRIFPDLSCSESESSWF